MIRIVPLDESHIDGLHLIETMSFAEPWSKNAFLGEIDNSYAYYIVAQKDDKVVGYAGMWTMFDEGHITNIAVDQSQRRMGVGKKLIEALIEKAKELRLMGLTLEVRKSNIAAQNLYSLFGFYSVGERKDYYRYPIEAAVIMWKYFIDEED